jgi:hypothetical protein
MLNRNLQIDCTDQDHIANTNQMQIQVCSTDSASTSWRDIRHDDMDDTTIDDSVVLGSGSFGQVVRSRCNTCIKRGTWHRHTPVPVCATIMRLTRRLNEIFPIHFPELFSCETYGDLRHQFKMSMQCVDGGQPLRDYMSSSAVSWQTLAGIHAQLYYISRVLNSSRVSIFHNDFSIRNIMVGNRPQAKIVLDQDTACILSVHNVPLVYVIDLDFVGDSFSNDRDCFMVTHRKSSGFRCTRDIDTLEGITDLVPTFDQIWDDGVPTTLGNLQFTFRQTELTQTVHEPSEVTRSCVRRERSGWVSRLRRRHPSITSQDTRKM